SGAWLALSSSARPRSGSVEVSGMAPPYDRPGTAGGARPPIPGQRLRGSDARLSWTRDDVRSRHAPTGEWRIMSLDDTLLNRLYRHVSHTDLQQRDPAVREAIAAQVATLSRERQPGRATVRVFNPSRAEDGWTTRHIVIQVVTENMPFLVDSVLGELSRSGLAVHLLVHPQVVVRRTGADVQVLDVDPTDAGPDDVVESWIHVEVDRLHRDVAREQLQGRLETVLQDV